MDTIVSLSPTRIDVNSLGNVLFRSGTELIANATIKDKVHLSGLSIFIYKVDTGVSLRLNVEGLVQIVLADATLFEYDALVIHQSSTKQLNSKTKVLNVYSRLLTSVFNGGCCVAAASEGGDCTPNNVLNSADDVVTTLVEGDTAKAMSSGITIAKVGTQVQFSSSVVQAITWPRAIYHPEPSYTTGNTGDYPTLYAAGYFDLMNPTVPVQMLELGADNFTLASNNRFGNTARYTATDGTPSDVGTARFTSGYGMGVPNVVRDNYCNVMWYNIPFGDSTTTWDNAQTIVDTQNVANLGGYNDWIRPTRATYTYSAIPDNNADLRDSPNLIVDVGTRRYCTCERVTFDTRGYVMFHLGDEILQSSTTTASGQNRVVLCRLMTLSELFG